MADRRSGSLRRITRDPESEAMTLTYEEILNTLFDDLPAEAQLPAGTWRVRCRAVTPKEDAILLTQEAINACEDVDADELAVWEEEKDEDAVTFHRLRGTPRAVGAQLRALGKAIGVTVATPKDLVGQEYYATLTYDPNKKDPSRPWPRWKNFQPIDSNI